MARQIRQMESHALPFRVLFDQLLCWPFLYFKDINDEKINKHSRIFSFVGSNVLKCGFLLILYKL